MWGTCRARNIAILLALIIMPLVTLPIITHVHAAPVSKKSAKASSGVKFQRPYILGVVAFNQKKYAKAIKYLNKALAVDPTHRGALTYLLYAGYSSKDWKSTARGGEGLIAQGKDLSRTLYMTGKAHRNLGNEAKAREYFSRIVAREDDPYQTAAEFAIAETGLSYRPKGWHGSVIVAYESDDNVSVGPVDNVGTSGSGIEDDRWSLTALASYDKRLGERWYIGASILGLGQWYEHSAGDAFAVDLVRPEFHVGLVGNGWDVKLAYEKELLDFDRKTYLDTDRFILTYNQKITKNYRMTFIGRAADEDFKQDSSQNADKYDFEWRNRLQLPWLMTGAYIYLEARYRHNDTDRRTTYSYKGVRFKAGAFSPLPWWRTYVSYYATSEKRDYDVAPVSKTRDDRIREYYFKVGKIWNRYLRNEIYHRRYVRHSTIDTSSYDQDMVGANLIFTY